MSGPYRPRRAAGRQPRSGRRAGESGTREAILAAARQQFGDRGYDGATIRAIAAAAGVDPALVHHFFGTKEHLFAAAMRLPVSPGDIIDAALAPGAREAGRGLGEHLVRTMISAWDQAEMRATFLGLLRSAMTSEQAAAMLREFVTGTILSRLAQAAAQEGAGTEGSPPGADAVYRAALAGSQVLGLALARYVLRLGPLAQADPGELAAALGPTLDRYLTGELAAGTAG